MAGHRRVLPILAALIAIISLPHAYGANPAKVNNGIDGFEPPRNDDDDRFDIPGRQKVKEVDNKPALVKAANGDINNNQAVSFNKKLPGDQAKLKQLPRQSAAGVAGSQQSVKISESVECKEDVKTHCKGSSATNNFAVLDCLQNDIDDNAVISDACQHFVWTYKKSLTNDIRFDSAAHDVCATDLPRLECSKLEKGKGEVIPCLIEAKDNITQPGCKQFLTKMETLIFSDYRLVSLFTDRCTNDIEALQCGRLADDEDGSPHNQGKTVECLSQKVEKLTPECKTQILRIAELQADDYHLDRPLYYACRLDRERFCEHTQAGSGKVYKCLFKHKFEPDMSSDCRSMIVVRQKLQHEDVKVNKGLFDACRADIRTHHCLRNVKLPSGRNYRLSTVLLCLEGVQRDGEKIDSKCVAELNDARRALMEDYQINPEIVSGCADEIATQCKGLEAGGKTMHCLMGLAQQEFKEQHISVDCKRQLEMVLREADVGENVMMDPFLVDSCQEVMDTVCKSHKAEDMMSCLMEKMGSDLMTEECEDRLMEIQYFMARDFKLGDSRLFKYCKRDARELCGAPEHWYDPDNMSPEGGPTTFMCLYRHLNPEREEIIDRALSRPCAFEVLRVMRQRSISVKLEPRIEIPCLADLGRLCSERIKKGDEMQCLMDNYDELGDECQEAVEKYTEDEDHYIDLDKILMKACTPMIKQFCGALIEDDTSPPEDVMECLIKHKVDPGMDQKCAAGISHHQLTSLKDYRFSYKFKEACKEDVVKVCKNDRIRKKSDVVKCLSESVRNATLLDAKQVVSMACRNQLNFELLQRSENIELDPELKAACGQNIEMYCSNITPGKAATIECLKKHTEKLDQQCKEKIFKREELEALDSRIDFALVSTCKEMIKTYCRDAEPRELFPCLRRSKDEQDFSLKCRRMVVERLRIRSTDIRLNPQLNSDCQMDINKFCKAEIAEFQQKPNLFEGKILMCLRKQFVSDKDRLTDSCGKHISRRIQESMRDFQQDPRLARHCKAEISELCSDAMTANRADPDGGHVDECLLRNLQQQKIKNEKCILELARIAAESKADVHVDPLLYRACALNIQSFCKDIPRGQGRQMSCLLSTRENPKRFPLEPECKKMLDDRVQLWEFAAKGAPIETVAELSNLIVTSPSRSYLMMVLCAMIGSLFIAGLFCGRVTKRVSTQVKNK